MDFLKKHYEKILLGVVLLGLVVGAALLPLMIGNERQTLEDKSTQLSTRPVKPLAPLNLSRQEELIKRLETPLNLDLSAGHKLFNPELWQKTVDGRLFKPPSSGVVNLCQVITITPLWTTMTLENVITNDTGVRYAVGIERAAAALLRDRSRRTYYAALNEKKDKEGFTIVEIKGQPENPTALMLDLNDTTSPVELSKEKPFRRVDGYMADLKYDPEKKNWPNRREQDRIQFGGESYIIVAIHKNEVVLSAESNNKKTSIPYNPGP